MKWPKWLMDIYVDIGNWLGRYGIRGDNNEGDEMEHPDEAPQHDPKETVEEHATDQFTADKIDRELPDKEPEEDES